MQDIMQIAESRLKKLDMLEVQQWFELVERADASTITITEVVKKISDCLMHLTLPVASHRLYRCRLVKEGNAIPVHLSDLLSPPAEEAKQGRCNLAGKPVLYVSDRPDILIQECHIDIGQQFVIAQFNRLPMVKEDISCFLLGIEPRVLLGDTDDVKKIEKIRVEGLGDGYKNLREIERLLHESFLRDDDPSGRAYMFTANLCDHIFSSNEYAEAIFYPSIATNASGHNYAVRPGIIDKAFKPEKFGLFAIERDGTVKQKNGATLGEDGALDWGKDVLIDAPVPVGVRSIDPNDPDIYIAPWR